MLKPASPWDMLPFEFNQPIERYRRYHALDLDTFSGSCGPSIAHRFWSQRSARRASVGCAACVLRTFRNSGRFLRKK